MLSRATIQRMMAEYHLPSGLRRRESFFQPLRLLWRNPVSIESKEFQQPVLFGKRVIPVPAHAEFVIFQFRVLAVLGIVIAQRRIEPDAVGKQIFIRYFELRSEPGGIPVGVYVVSAHYYRIERDLVVLQFHLPGNFKLSFVSR